MSTRPLRDRRLHGVGLGLRRSMRPELAARAQPVEVDFMEVAPENWIGVGGAPRPRIPRAAPGRELREIDFINAVLAEADCDLLLDVNNIYVNAINHRYDAHQFLPALPAGRVDRHGADVCDPVWDLLAATCDHCDVRSTVLERDFNMPPIDVLMREVELIRELQARQRFPCRAGDTGSRSLGTAGARLLSAPPVPHATLPRNVTGVPRSSGRRARAVPE